MENYWSKKQCEYLRAIVSVRFNMIRESMIECGRWAAPHRIKWLLSQVDGARNNMHIVDSTHVLALRSFVAGFLEGNTSATRPWYLMGSGDEDVDDNPENKAWLQKYTNRQHQVLQSSNFYYQAGQFYYDYGTFNTGAHVIDELKTGLHFHTLLPGQYKVLNNGFGEAVVMVREFSMTVKALVDTYGKMKNGTWDWSNFSKGVKKMYGDGNYTQMIDVVQVIKRNDAFDPEKPNVRLNRQWIRLTYEVGGCGQYNGDESGYGSGSPDPEDENIFLRVSASKRKPFIVGKSTDTFEYGEKGPTLDALGLIKSLNKKAIGKDQALEQMLRPALQGPANLKKSYITSAANSFVPLDPTSLAQKGIRSIFEINPAIGALLQDQSDLRQMVDKLYFADYLLYLSKNPKTRTATETNAIVQEQQLIIGPNLQSLNWTYNVPVVEFVADYVMFEDPHLEPPPAGLAGKFLQPTFISVFAQAQKAADLPSIERYISMIEQVGQIPAGAGIWDKVNLDKLADLYEDRLFLPAGLNNPQAKVDAMRQQALAQQKREQMLHETIPAMAGAARDASMAQQPQ